MYRDSLVITNYLSASLN